MKLVYMGTPDIARVCLEKLHTAGFDIAAVYTKPDTPKNRGMKMMASEVKQYAESVGLPVIQPVSSQWFKIDHCTGPAPRSSGRMLACILMQPYFGMSSTRCGKILP